MSITKIKIGQTVPLEPSTQNFSFLVNYPSPHVHITNTPDGIDYFLQNADNLLANISKVQFDSFWFDYLRIDQAIPFSITLDSYVGTFTSGGKKGSDYWTPSSGTTSHNIGAHGRGDVPAFFATGNGNILSTALYGYGGNSLRTLTLTADGSNVFLKQSYIAVQTQIPSMTLSGVVYILKSSLTSGSGEYTPSIYGLYVSPTRAILGQGKFDSDYNYLYVDPAGFKMSKTSSLRAQYGFRLGLGGYTNYSSWNNSFSVLQDGNVIYNVNNINQAAPQLYELIPPQFVTGATLGVSVP